MHIFQAISLSIFNIMTLEMLKSKIHRATVTQSALDYIGSITVDEALMEAAGLTEYEKVEIADVDTIHS